MANPSNVRLMLRDPTLTTNRFEMITPTSREELHQQNFSSNVRPIPYANRNFSGTLKKFNKTLAMVLSRGKVLLVVEIFLLVTSTHKKINQKRCLGSQDFFFTTFKINALIHFIKYIKNTTHFQQVHIGKTHF